MPPDQTDPDAPASELAKQEIIKGLQTAATSRRKAIFVTFRGPDAPQDLIIDADTAIDWPFLIRHMAEVLNARAPLPQAKSRG